jgi:hypothetical protein
MKIIKKNFTTELPIHTFATDVNIVFSNIVRPSGGRTVFTEQKRNSLVRQVIGYDITEWAIELQGLH